jgi:hypothetical protein
MTANALEPQRLILNDTATNLGRWVAVSPQNSDLSDLHHARTRLDASHATLMPPGYHPSVAAPGRRINVVRMMAGHREVEDRQFGVVKVQPGFAQSGMALEASRK